ncbi:MAG: FeoB-associated Cys-rich membrane protein [Eubacteriales bacterium]|nr:FeoB-associated Cys-rich membrane protein [Eubacteriales bacterium]MDD3883019.1 FeoB-associated Cys-rich membrane protein [Eubacteriales bacterium]MDD4513654.1 FeoB-associated Cys-rich membrane protein [Eubacteriales bacterium]
MSALDILLICLLAVLAFLALRHIIKGRGKCSCGCSGCPYTGKCEKERKKS